MNSKNRAILNGRGEEKDEKWKTNVTFFFVDDMYSWSNMSRFELKEKFVQKNVDLKIIHETHICEPHHHQCFNFFGLFDVLNLHLS